MNMIKLSLIFVCMVSLIFANNAITSVPLIYLNNTNDTTEPVINVTPIMIETNVTVEEYEPSQDTISANETLINIKTTVDEMQFEGYSVERITDKWLETELEFNIQMIYEQSGGKPNYDDFYGLIDEIKKLKFLAYDINDQLSALNKELDNLDNETYNLTSINNKYIIVKSEFADERYEKCQDLIDEIYDDISNLEAEQNILAAFYESTTKSLESFLYNNWIWILLIIIAVIIVYVFGHSYFERVAIKKEIKHLELKKKVLKDLIQKTQKDYFEGHNIPENTYHLRIEKFGELIRDVDRQIPTLKEQLVKRERKSKFVNKYQQINKELKDTKTEESNKKDKN